MGVTCSRSTDVQPYESHSSPSSSPSNSPRRDTTGRLSHSHSASSTRGWRTVSVGGYRYPQTRSAVNRSRTLDHYGHLCHSSAAHILNHDQLALFASLGRIVRYSPKEIIYNGGDDVSPDQALFYIIEGSCAVSKFVEFREVTVMGADGPVSSRNPRTTNSIRLPVASNQAFTNGHQHNHSGPLLSQQNHSVQTSIMPARWTNMQDKAENSFEVKLRTLENKAWFGYCTMLNMNIRQSTVTATEHTICLVWSEKALNELFAFYPGTSALLRDGIAGHRVMKELCNASFLANLQEEHSALLCTLFQSRFIPANTVIFEEGEPPTDNCSLFFLISGSAVMYQAIEGGGTNLVKAIEPGDIFGEACTLFRLPRIGTVKTNHASLVMELSLTSFTQFLKYTPGLGVDVRRAFNNNNIASVYLMQNPVILQAFSDFCETEHSSENVEFFRDAKAFRTSPLRQKALVQMDARAIYEKYIDPDAQRQVNLFSHTRDRITSAIEHNIINKLTFEEAEEEILHLMDRDSFARFKASGLFQEALQRCREKA